MEPKVSVISILPFEIKDSKPNLYPGYFIIPAGSSTKPGILTVEKSAFYVPMAFGAPSLQVYSGAIEVANSIVNDYIGALLGVGEDTRPGIFVKNEVFKNKADAAVQCAVEIEKYQDYQRRWFFELVQMADAEYSKHQQAKSISDLQKMAARELNLKDKPWLLSIEQLSVNNCPACYSPVNINATICGNCRYVINKEKYNPSDFATTLGTPPVK